MGAPGQALTYDIHKGPGCETARAGPVPGAPRWLPCSRRIVRRGDKCPQGVAVRHEGADAPERVRRVGVLHVAFDGKRSEHSGEGGFFRAIIARALEPDAGKRRFRGFPVPPVAPGPRAPGASASAGTVSGRTSRQTRCLLAIIPSRCFFAFPIAETAVNGKKRP